MAVFNNILAGASGATGAAAAFQIDRSLRFNSGDSAYLNHTPTSASNRKTWTWSGWIKRTVMGADKFIFSAGSDPSNFHYVRFNSNDKIEATEKIGDSVQSSLITSAVYRDPSAWMHIVYVYDSTQSTAANRLSLYVNGEKITSFGTSTYPSQNHDSYLNSTSNHFINARPNPAGYADAYLAEIHFIDGQALTADDFGEEDDNGVWQPIDCKNDLTYGTNGFYLNFSDNSSNSALGFDQRPGATQNPSVTGYGSATGGSPDNVVDGVASYTSEYDIRTNGAGVTLGTAVTASSKVRIYGTAESGSYEINDTSTNIAPSSWPNRGWTDISSALTFPISISSFGITGGSANDGGRLAAIEIDDVILTGTANNWTVNNLTAAGSAWNQSQTWSSSLSSTTGFRSSEPATNAFDGDTSTICSAVNDGVVTFTSPVTFASDSTIRVIVHGGDHTVTVNGGSDQTISAGSYQTVNFTNSSNSTFVMTFQRDTSADTGIRAIEIGGNVLVNSNVPDPNAHNIDSLIDTPTSYTADSGNNGGCYCTMNPLKSKLTLSNGNLDSTSPSDWKGAAGTIGMSSGKFYWEIDNVQSDEHVVGIVPHNTSNVTWNTTYGYGAETGVKYLATGGVSYGDAWGTGDVIGVAFDADNGILEFYKNGISQGVAATGLTDGPYLPSLVHNGSSRSVSINFGQRPWTYTPKSGHVALCTTNLSDPTIADGSTAMDTVTYTGNGSSKTISGVGFSPDLIWTKCRNQARSHYLMDLVRGISKYLISEQTSAEGTNTTNRILSVTSDGWTLGLNNSFNGNNDTYVAWAWDAGTSTVSNTDGSITSSVRANQTAGFSIVTATQGSGDSTWGHGLNTKPDLIILKARNQSYGWFVSHSGLDNQSTKFLRLHNTSAVTTNSNWFASTEPTSSVITTKAGGMWNSGDDFVAYCWAAVEGYSAFTSHTVISGTNFVYLGFRPRLVMLKRTGAGTTTNISYASWAMFDTERDTYNEVDFDTILYANRNYSEGKRGDSAGSTGGTYLNIDILSNGIRFQHGAAEFTQPSDEIIVMAWAEHPFKTARAR